MRKRNNIKFIFLDIGNVLFYFDFRIALRRLSSCSGKDPELIYDSMYVPTERLERGLINSYEYFDIFVSIFGNLIEFKDFKNIFNDIFAPNCQMLEKLALLKEYYTLAIVSNTNEMHIEYLKGIYQGYFDHFSTAVYSHEIGFKKPEEGFFMTALRMSGADASEVIYFDDIAENAQKARSLGIRSVVYKEYKDFEDEFNTILDGKK